MTQPKLNCQACQELDEAEGDEADCTQCELWNLRAGLDPACLIAFELYDRICNGLAADFGVLPPGPLAVLTEDEAEHVHGLMVIIHDEILKTQKEKIQHEAKMRANQARARVAR